MSAPHTDPHPEWLQDWHRLTQAWNDALNGQEKETPESLAIWEERDVLEYQLAATPVQTIAGACAVLAWILEESKGAFTYDGHEVALARTLRSLQAMAGGKPASRILELYQEVESLNQAGAAYETGLTGAAEDEAMERLFWIKRDKLVDEMMELPSITAADFAAKAIASTDKGTQLGDWETSHLWQEARGLVA